MHMHTSSLALITHTPNSSPLRTQAGHHKKVNYLSTCTNYQQRLRDNVILHQKKKKRTKTLPKPTSTISAKPFFAAT